MVTEEARLGAVSPKWANPELRRLRRGQAIFQDLLVSSDACQAARASSPVASSVTVASHMCVAASMLRDGLAGDGTFSHRSQVIAFELGSGERLGQLGQVRHAGIPARGVGQREHARSVQEAIGCEVFGQYRHSAFQHTPASSSMAIPNSPGRQWLPTWLSFSTDASWRSLFMAASRKWRKSDFKHRRLVKAATDASAPCPPSCEAAHQLGARPSRI